MATTTARDLMTKRFLRISTLHTLRETMGILLYGDQKKQDTGAVAVIDQEGDFAGIITPDDVVHGLTESTPAGSQEAFLNQVKDKLSKTVADILPKELVTALPETSLAELLKLASENECECIPVIEQGRVEGIVYLTDIFKAAAMLALNPETDGIALNTTPSKKK